MRAALVAAGIIAFLAVSALVARWLTADNAERTKVEGLLRAQAHGDADGMLRDLDGCAGPCATTVRADARRLHRPGALQIVDYESATSHALGRTVGQTRVVWKTPSTLTVVQCVTVSRSGNPVAGMRVALLGISAPIGRQSPC